VIIALFSIIGNSIKVSSIGSTVVWSDLVNGLFTDVVYNMYISKYYLQAFLIVIFLILCVVFLIRSGKFRIRKENRIILGILACIAFGCAWNSLNNKEVLATEENKATFESFKDQLSVQGPGPYILYSKISTIMNKPLDYNEAEMKRIVKKYKKLASENTNYQKNGKVIYILSEAFCDPTKFSGTTWKKDPMPTIRQLQSEHGGYMLSPVFGAGTANVEYSALTGFDYSTLNQSLNAYSYLEQAPSRSSSIVQTGNSQGLESTAIHPYLPSGYGRGKVLPQMGFKNIYFRDEMNKKFPLDRLEGYTSDETFLGYVYQSITKNNTDSTLFHTISMQNHYPYVAQEKGDISAKDSLLKNESEVSDGHHLAMYARGVSETDSAIKEFLDKLKKEDDNITVIFYGDHYPSLNKSLYEDNTPNISDDDFANKHLTTYFVWNNHGNYATNKKQVISPSYLSAIGVKSSYKKVPAFYNFLDKMSEEIPAFNVNNNVFLNENVKSTKLSA
ncbi:LTA synthase family protein, partial [Enterococcus faecium]|nr:LTA synthase family protein [Enterococcus faecium]